MNVGQIYRTIERLTLTGLAEPAGALPRRLSDTGAAGARTWMTAPVLDGLPEWTEMLDQVLVTSSIDPVSAKPVAGRYRHWWEADLAAARYASEPTLSDVRLAFVAREGQAVAGIAWLGSAIATLVDFDAFRPLSDS